MIEYITYSYTSILQGFAAIQIGGRDYTKQVHAEGRTRDNTESRYRVPTSIGSMQRGGLATIQRAEAEARQRKGPCRGIDSRQYKERRHSPYKKGTTWMGWAEPTGRSRDNTESGSRGYTKKGPASGKVLRQYREWEQGLYKKVSTQWGGLATIQRAGA